MKGQIFKIHSDFYYVNISNVIYECKVREVLKKQKQKVLVGDFVECDEINSDNHTAVINKVYLRENILTRPAVANIEQVVIVSAIKEPELSFEQLNRYICFARYHNLKISLCFNKNDLSLDDSVIEKVFSIYEPLGLEIVFTSALENLGIDDLMELLNNKTTVFCGNSGVGKSSLINAISPDLKIKTKQVSEKTLRGVHTTRHCEIIEIKKDDSIVRIVDTPGFSNLKFDFLLPNDVDLLFDDISIYNDNCKYADCLHIQENGCNVIENLDKIDETRYQSYVAFVNEAKEYKEKIKKIGTKKETLQKENKNKTVAKISAKNRQVARNTSKQNAQKDIEP